MARNKVNVSLAPFLCLVILGCASVQSDSDGDTVHVQVRSDDYDGTVSVPRWVLRQAAASSFGMVANNNWSYDDEALPSSIKIDSDYYNIRVDLRSFDEDRARVKVLDSQTIQVEVKQRYVNRYGSATSRTVNRRFTVPRNYDVYKSYANIKNGVMLVQVPNANGNYARVDRDFDRSVKVSY